MSKIHKKFNFNIPTTPPIRNKNHLNADNIMSYAILIWIHFA